jgi:hypothetical protein
MATPPTSSPGLTPAGTGREELVLDTTSKASFIAARLSALGLDEPRIVGEVQPYAVHHGVAAEG